MVVLGHTPQNHNQDKDKDTRARGMGGRGESEENRDAHGRDGTQTTSSTRPYPI